MSRLGQRLYEERSRKGLTVEEVATATKIRPQFIRAIEQGNYQILPSKAYAQGFVKNYISFLGLSLRDSLAMFRREFDEREYVDVLPESFTQQHTIPFTHKNWQRTFFGISVVLFALIAFLMFQYRAAIFDPSLTVLSPKENSIVTSENVTVSGSTDTNTILSVNNEQAYVDANGHFTKTIAVFPGKSKIIVIAINKFGKRKIIELHITVNTHS